jgi:hypothetical protein
LTRLLNPLLPVDLQNPLNPNHPLADGLRGFWCVLPSLAGGKSLHDLSGKHHHATLNGVVRLNGGSLAFDGSTGYGRVSQNARINNLGKLSVAVLARVSADGDLLNKSDNNASNGDWWFSTVNGGDFGFTKEMSGANITRQTIYPGVGIYDGKVHLLAATWDGTTNGTGITLYLDGVATTMGGGTNGAGSIVDMQQDLYLGSNNGASAHFTNATIYSILLFNRVLSPTEIACIDDESRRQFPGLLNRVGTTSYFLLNQNLFPPSEEPLCLPLAKPWLPVDAARPLNMQSPLATGLKGFYPMVAASANGRFVHDIAQNNPFSLNDARWLSDGFGSGVSIDATGRFLTTGGVAGASNFTPYGFTSQDFTISLLVRVRDNSNSPVLFCQGAYTEFGYYSQVGTDGAFYLVTSQSGAVQATSSAAGCISGNRPQFLTYVRRGSSVRLYLNGVDVTATAGTHVDPAPSTMQFQLGRYYSQAFNIGQNYLNAMIYGFGVHQRALSPVEVATFFREVQANYPLLLNRVSDPFSLSGLIHENDDPLRLIGTINDGTVGTDAGDEVPATFVAGDVTRHLPVNVTRPLNTQATLASQAKGFWPMISPLDGGKFLYDLSGYRNHGTLNSGVTWGGGQYGRCLRFDGGSNGYLTTGTGTFATHQPDPWFCSFWYKSTSSSDVHFISCTNGSTIVFAARNWLGRAMDFVTDGFGNEYLNSGVNPNDGLWHHFVFAVGPGWPRTISVYQDGVPIVTSTGQFHDFGGTGITTGVLSIGSDAGQMAFQLADFLIAFADINPAGVQALGDESRRNFPFLLNRVSPAPNLAGVLQPGGTDNVFRSKILRAA